MENENRTLTIKYMGFDKEGKLQFIGGRYNKKGDEE
jgi:hypothetical protein